MLVFMDELDGEIYLDIYLTQENLRSIDDGVLLSESFTIDNKKHHIGIIVSEMKSAEYLGEYEEEYDEEEI